MSGIKAHMGIFYNMMDKFKLSLDALNSANKKLKDDGNMKKTTLLKMLLSQMGVVCIVKVGDVEQVAKCFYKENNVGLVILIVSMFPSTWQYLMMHLEGTHKPHVFGVFHMGS